MYNGVIGILCLIFVAVWLATGLEANKTISGNKGWKALLRIVVPTVVITLFLNVEGIKQWSNYEIFHDNYVMQALGILLCAGGISLAIWARIYLGKNWGFPMALKEKRDLVITGPYHLVRHPIYTGLTVAFIGCLFAGGLMWLVWITLLVPYFIHSALKEENLMQNEFGETYLTYKKKTKMFIPFVL